MRGLMQHLGLAIILAAICLITPKISAKSDYVSEDEVVKLMTLESAAPLLESADPDQSRLLSRVERSRGRVNKPLRKSCNDRQVQKKGELDLKHGTNVNASIETRINETINMFLDGESKITLSGSDEVIIVLGISGSGKSTLLQFLTGDNEKLIGAKVCNTMIIKDSNNKIGSSIKSHTKIPELGIDQDGNNFYDCPGFKDTNDAIYDVASSYFIKKVFDNAKKVKILFTISHSKVKHGNDRGGFISLADQIFDLIPDLDKFNSSIALIVTKVDKIIDNYDYDDMPIFLSDEEKIENIADFLEEVKHNYEELVSLKGREKVEKMSQLIDILVTRDTDGNLTRIGLFDRPYKEGPLSKDERLQESKEKLRHLINNNLQYSDIENDNIQYSISDNSKLYLNDFKDAILNSINLRKFELNKDIATSYLNSYEDVTKITQFQTEFSSVIESFLQAGNENYLESYIKLRNILKDMNNFNADKDILNILNLIKFLNLLQKFSPNSDFTISKYVSDFSNIGQFLTNLQNWFSFMKELTLYYSTFEMQKEKQFYQIIDKEVKKIKNYKEEIILTKSNFSTCLQNLSSRFSYAKKSYDTIVSTEASFEDLLYQQVFDIISYTMGKSNLEIQVMPTEIYVSGEFVRFSEALQLIAEKYSKHFKFSPTSPDIYIFAYNRIMIDQSLSTDSSGHLTIIAPVWEIVTDIEIKLLGRSTLPHKQSTIYPMYSQNMGDGKDGAKGKDGHNGKNSGNFIGIGNDIINPQQLSIVTQGGEGGDGQNGENGGSGKKGEYSSIFTTRVRPYVCNNKNKIPYKFSEIAYQFNCDQSPYHQDKFILIIKNDFTYKRGCTLHGPTGSVGGSGGNGGNAGRGGTAGLILLQFSNNEDQKAINTKALNGKDGRPGNGGKGGQGGYSWKHSFTAVEYNDYYIINLIPFHSYCFHSIANFRTTFHTGRNGSPGRMIPEDSLSIQNPIEIQNLPNTIQQYKNQAYSKIIKGNNKEFLTQFLTSGLDVENLNKYYSILDLLKEIIELEKIDNNSKQHLNIQRLYDSLFKRFSELFKHVSDTDNIKLKASINSVFLSQTYTTNIQKLRHVTDISALITFIKDKIHLYEKNDLIRLKSATKMEFTTQIRKKIDESHNTLTNQISSHVTNFETEVENAILITIDDITKLQERGDKFNNALLHKKREVEEKIEKLEVISIVEKISRVLGVFYPIFNTMAQVEQQYFKFTEVVSLNIINPNIDGHALSLLKNSREGVNSATEIITEKLDEDDFMSKLTSSLQQKRILMENEISHIKTAVNKVIKNNVKLSTFRKQIDEKLIPVLMKIKSDYINFVEQIDKTNSITLDISSWKIKLLLKDLNKWITQITREFKLEDRFINIIDSLKDSIDILLSLHDKLEMYNEEQNILNYLSIVSTSSETELEFTDSKYSSAMINLENISHSNMILSLYSQLLTTVKQYVFPFAESYIHFEHISTNFSGTIHDKTNKIIQQIKYISDELTKKRATIVSGQDKDVFTGNFYSKFIISEPFYTWTNDNEIEKFLSGEEITLKSNIFTPKIKNAVKFNYIELDIKTKNLKQQNTLDYILNQFIIRMKHSGKSHYKCDTKYFEITSDVQIIEYSYEKQNNQTPVYQNEVYRKISNGDLLLSPYTEWKMQLIDTKENGFDELRDYFNDVTLGLVGSGQYLRDNVYICETDLAKFYIPYDERDKKFDEAVDNLIDTIELEATVKTRYYVMSRDLKN